MVRTTKILSGIAAAVVVAFVLMLLLGLFVPIYTDEVGSKSQLSRTFLEGGRYITLLPQCRRTWSSPMPLSW